jgi:hypothetical protein
VNIFKIIHGIDSLMYVYEPSRGVPTSENREYHDGLVEPD